MILRLNGERGNTLEVTENDNHLLVYIIEENDSGIFRLTTSQARALANALVIWSDEIDSRR